MVGHAGTIQRNAFDGEKDRPFLDALFCDKMAQLVLQHRWQDHPLVAMGDDAVFNSLDGDVGEIADVEPVRAKA